MIWHKGRFGLRRMVRQRNRQIRIRDSRIAQLDDALSGAQVFSIELKDALEVEKHKHLDTSNWALEQQDRADVAEKRIRKLEAVAEMGPEVSIADGDVWLRFGDYALISVKSIMDRCGPITKKNIRQWRDGILAALEDGE